MGKRGGSEDRQLADKEGFPEPEAELAGGRVWKREAIERWAKANGRTIRDG